MLFSIVEGSGSIARSGMLVHSHSGEIAPTIMEAPTRVQLGMVKDPGVKLLRRWVRGEMAVPSLPQLREVIGKVYQVPASSGLPVQVGSKGAMHWLPEGSSSVGMGGTSFSGPGIRTKRGMVK